MKLFTKIEKYEEKGRVYVKCELPIRQTSVFDLEYLRKTVAQLEKDYTEQKAILDEIETNL